jgi:hypothetical protein
MRFKGDLKMSGKLNKPKILAMLSLVVAVAVLGLAVQAQAGSVYLWASGAADGIRWDDSYNWLDHSYVSGNAQLETQRQYWSPGWGAENIYIEIPIALLAGQTVTIATLQLESLGFGTGYYYGSAAVSHLNSGGNLPTGNIANDNPHTWGGDGSWIIFDSYADPPNGGAGIKSFDVTAEVLADLTAGRAYSTFMLDASRDTVGTLYASETTGQGPRIYATGDFAVPIPGAVWLLGSGLLGLAGVRKWRK